MPDQSLPTGTVTFLFTDIEGSTRLVEDLGETWVSVLEQHHRILRDAVEGNGGVVVNTEGDAVFAVFSAAVDAVSATIAAQRSLSNHEWPGAAQVRVRMGLHTGDGMLGGSDYTGLDVHRAARIAGTGHGGQVVISETTAVLVERSLAGDVGLLDLGKHRLKDLTEPESLFQLEVGDLPSEFAPLRTLDTVPNNLPVQLTSFVGRSHELEEVVVLCRTNRQVTLTGPAGTGKTRLALQVGAELSDEFADGVYFVDLSPISGSEVVPSQILAAIGPTASQGDLSPTDSLRHHLAGKEVFLIIDNFEHVVEAAVLVSDLVKTAPRSRFLVTSRSPLHITGEQTYPVPPLAVRADGDAVAGSAQAEAVRLFEERARAVRPDFEVTPSERRMVAELVAKLDGLPLAIELVASRVRLLTVDTILDRLEASMNSSGAVDLPERQRTLNGAIGWSYDLLRLPVQRLFARLSVFAGPAQLTQIEEVCGPGSDIDVIDGLQSLADQSLIRIVETETGTSYGMLYVVRQFATARLSQSAEEAETRNRHLVVYTELAEEVSSRLHGVDRRERLNQLEDAHDNVRAAFDWAVENGEVDLVRRLTYSMWRFWQARGHLHEGWRRIQRALELPGGDPGLRAKALEALGGVLWWQGRGAESTGAYEEAVKLLRDTGTSTDLANGLYNYGSALGVSGEREKAMAALDEAESIYRSVGDYGGLGDISWGRGLIETLSGGDDDVRLRELKASIDYYERAGNDVGKGWSLFQLAWLFVQRNESGSAWPYLQSGLDIFARHHDLSAGVLFVAMAVVIASDLGDEVRAARLGGAFRAQRQFAGSELTDHEALHFEGLDEQRLEALTGQLKTAYHEGLEMGFEEAVAYVLAGPIDEAAD